VLVRFVLLVLFAFVPWTSMSVAADSGIAPEGEGPGSECSAGSLYQGPSLDDPNVDTDPERPIVEDAAFPGEEGDDQSDDGADGMCRSETLELWFQFEGPYSREALAPTSRAIS
jgi:hypothetical protein